MPHHAAVKAAATRREEEIRKVAVKDDAGTSKPSQEGNARGKLVDNVNVGRGKACGEPSPVEEGKCEVELPEDGQHDMEAASEGDWESVAQDRHAQRSCGQIGSKSAGLHTLSQLGSPSLVSSKHLDGSQWDV